MLSPVLFAIYNVITMLRNFGYDLCVGSTFVGCILYADDIVLLSCSCHGVQRVVNFCSGYGIIWDICFSPDIVQVLNAKRPCDCRVLCLRLKSSLCSCAHSISHMTSFGCRDQGRDSVCPVL